MKRLTIIYHSQSGTTEAMAQAVLRGARTEEAVTSRLLRAFDASVDDLKHSDAIIFGTPENFGYMSGALKDFFDRTYGEAHALQLNLPYALFISAGNDGTGAVRWHGYFHRIEKLYFCGRQGQSYGPLEAATSAWLSATVRR